MNSKRSLCSYIVALAMATSPVVPVQYAFAAGASCEEAKEKPIKSCSGKIGDANTANGVNNAAAGEANTADSVNTGAGTLKNQATGNAMTLADATAKCKDDFAACEKISCGADEAEKQKAVEECKKGVQAAADKGAAGATQAADAAGGAGATESASSGGSGGGGGGMGDMMPMLLGAALGAGAMMLMNKKDKDKDKDKDKEDDNSCTGQNGYKNSDCNDQLIAKCAAEPSSQACKDFTARYCASTSGSDGSGEGIGSTFCKSAAAETYCKVEGRAMCPSCLQLETNKSPACQANPTLCLAQNSTDQINAAKTTCPTDPMFSDPAYANGGGTSIPATQLAGATTPVLSETTGATGTGTNPNSSSNGAYNSASASGSAKGSAASEVAGTRQAPGSSGGGYGAASAGGSGSASGAFTDQVGSGGRAVASTNGGLAPDITGRYGASVFAASSQTLKSRCAVGKLLNCNP